MTQLLQDVRYGLRTLGQSPGFTLTTVLSLALAIGASTTVFSLVNSVLLRPLPYKEPERIVVIWETVRRQEVERRGVSFPDYLDWRAENQSFSDIAALKITSFNLSGIREPERVPGEYITASYFSVFGVSALHGRTFLQEEDRFENPEKLAVVSYRLWQRHFGSNLNLINQNIKLNEENYRVVGIMPETFQGTVRGTEVWVLLTSCVGDPVLKNPEKENLMVRGSRGLTAMARLKPNVSPQQAQSEMDALSLKLEQLYPRSNTNRGALVVPLFDEWLGDAHNTLLLFMAAAGCVLLIACGNVANLQLVRASNRRKEMAIRAALGASRSRLIRQLLTESVLLALLGGTLGLLLALWGIDLVVSLSPFTLPWFVRVQLDARVFGFTFLISTLTGIAFGLFPALAASRPELNESLKEGRVTWWRSRKSFFRLQLRGVLVVIEIALSVVLLIGAGLMTKSFQQLYLVELGFTPEKLVTMRVELPTTRYNEQAAITFTNTLLERLQGLPQLSNSTLASHIPLGDGSSATVVAIEGRPADPPGKEIRVYGHHVGPNYFSTLKIKLMHGREFQIDDTRERDGVVIVSQTFAERFWPGQDPVGKRIKEGSDPDAERRWYTITGVAADVHHRNIREIPNDDPDIYFCLLQRPVYDVGLIARSGGEAQEIKTTLTRVVQSIDPELPVYAALTMQQRIANRTIWFRTGAWLMSIFAVLALVLALVGTSGMMSYVVTLRTHEIGIRMAVGATERDILKMVLGESLLLIGAGIGLGLLAAFIGTGLLSGFLYGVSATDRGVFAGIALLLAGLSVLASYLPARRAMKLNPMAALRQE